MPKAKDLPRDELTPFAAALRDWMWDQRPSWPRSKMVVELGVARGTLDSWLRSIHNPKGSQPTLPIKDAVGAVMRVTGWDEATMKALTGYEELPPVGEYEYTLEQIAQWPEFDAAMRGNVRDFLADVHRRFADLRNRRPPRRDKAPALREQSVTDERVPTPLNHKRPRTPATSGK